MIGYYFPPEISIPKHLVDNFPMPQTQAFPARPNKEGKKKAQPVPMEIHIIIQGHDTHKPDFVSCHVERNELQLSWRLTHTYNYIYIYIYIYIYTDIDIDIYIYIYI